MKKNYCFLVVDKDIYFYKYEKNIFCPIKKGLFNRIVFLILKKLNLPFPKFILCENIFNYDRIIVTDSATNISLIKTLKKYYKNTDIFLYYMNVITENNKYLMELFQNNNIYTFDENDSWAHEIKYRHTPYSSNLPFKEGNRKYDTVFLGRAKNRIDEINRIIRAFDERKIKLKMLVLGAKNLEYSIDTYISYEEYLEYISNSITILEIIEAGQSGCTLRFMESLFFKKKLITNNKDIVNDLYYNNQNVFILGVDSLDNLVNFINSPYADEFSIQDLDFQNWISNFEGDTSV